MTKNERSAKIFKAFCDDSRLTVLELLRGGEMCACELLEILEISQPALSYHMKILCAANVVTARQEGKRTHYKINYDGIDHAKSLMAFYDRPSSKEETA